ncbi:PREDICTED: UPF0481 protein At3g47200-like [Nelumbo nucifera]|uniref:Uncharacterized protein n=2 Tax=Nelumbo nucifera TaxID=4432 RepID=A0A822ZLP4_NELNU|nr:PREDICTED: UPF0481 protein At3g47200-like [Nelumbo nucifera]DAD42668.1 TPA_asm: hypothetical protein HUJ06_000898 [Nelumbo nucifera]
MTEKRKRMMDEAMENPISLFKASAPSTVRKDLPNPFNAILFSWQKEFKWNWSTLLGDHSTDEWLSEIIGDKEGTTQSDTKVLMREVPRIMQEIKENEKCYRPEVISIGPYHHGGGEKEKHKIRIACKLASEDKIKMTNLYVEVEKRAQDAKRDYLDTSENFRENEFARMMFLDGCFIVYFIYCVAKDRLEDMEMKNDDIFFAAKDLFLMENQLPFWVLEELASLAYPDEDWMKMVRKFVNATNSLVAEDVKFDSSNPQNSESSQSKRTKPHHLLDLLRTKLLEESNETDGPRKGRSDWLPPNPFTLCSFRDSSLPLTTKDQTLQRYQQQTSCAWLSNMFGSRLSKCCCCCRPNWREQFVWHKFRSVKELKAVGIKFKMSKSSSLKSVRFRLGFIYGYVYLPALVVDRSTKARFLNLIAYERCLAGGSEEKLGTVLKTEPELELLCPPVPGRNCPTVPDNDVSKTLKLGITSYICFLDSLIDDADDVKELRSDGVLFNYLASDKEVADLINELVKGLVDSDQFDQVKLEIQDYCKRKIRPWVAEVLIKHFKTPWTILALLAPIYYVAFSVSLDFYKFRHWSNFVFSIPTI